MTTVIIKVCNENIILRSNVSCQITRRFFLYKTRSKCIFFLSQFAIMTNGKTNAKMVVSVKMPVDYRNVNVQQVSWEITVKKRKV